MQPIRADVGAGVEGDARIGASLDQLPALVEAKTVTLAKLVAIAPPGTEDPTASVYNSTMWLMAGLLAVALVANALVRPVDPKHHLKEGNEGDGG